jgi:hypothetical protein
MDDPITRLPRECLALIHELFTKEVVDNFDGEFGLGGYGFITNGRLYKLGFSTEDNPHEFTLSSGCDCPYWEASPEALDRLVTDMNKAYPEAHYQFRGEFGYQMGVSTTGSVPEQAERKALVQAELLRCKRILDQALDGQFEVISASHEERRKGLADDE